MGIKTLQEKRNNYKVLRNKSHWCDFAVKKPSSWTFRHTQKVHPWFPLTKGWKQIFTWTVPTKKPSIYKCSILRTL